MIGLAFREAVIRIRSSRNCSSRCLSRSSRSFSSLLCRSFSSFSLSLSFPFPPFPGALFLVVVCPVVPSPLFLYAPSLLSLYAPSPLFHAVPALLVVSVLISIAPPVFSLVLLSLSLLALDALSLFFPSLGAPFPLFLVVLALAGAFSLVLLDTLSRAVSTLSADAPDAFVLARHGRPLDLCPLAFAVWSPLLPLADVPPPVVLLRVSLYCADLAPRVVLDRVALLLDAVLSLAESLPLVVLSFDALSLGVVPFRAVSPRPAVPSRGALVLISSFRGAPPSFDVLLPGALASAVLAPASAPGNTCRPCRRFPSRGFDLPCRPYYGCPAPPVFHIKHNKEYLYPRGKKRKIYLTVV